MAGYIGSKVAVVSSGAERKKVFTATSGQTSFTGLSYTVNNVHVFQNGVRLVDGTDYTATNGNSITLTVGAAADDQVVVVSYNTFQTSDTVSASTGGTFAGDVNFTGAFTSQGIDDNANATAITIDSSENVGIGTTSPSSKMHIVGATSAERTLIIEDTFGNDVQIQASVSGGNASMVFKTEDTEAMRIDSSGNVLVGTTSDLTDANISAGITGIALRANKQLAVSRTGNTVAQFNRNTSDGDIVAFRKDGSTVGSIGTVGNDLTVGNDDAGLRFYNGINAITPFNLTTNADLDAATDLGTNTIRFEDLYLSGGVYLGGTGSANKLDDYEEGSFTPTLEGTGTQGVPNYVDQRGQYTKIGDMVHFSLFVGVSSWSTAPSGFLRIRNLPFSSKATNGETTGSVMHEDINTAGMTLVYFWASNINEMRMYYLQDNAGWIQQSIANEAQEFYITGTYKTS